MVVPPEPASNSEVAGRRLAGSGYRLNAVIIFGNDRDGEDLMQLIALVMWSSDLQQQDHAWYLENAVPLRFPRCWGMFRQQPDTAAAAYGGSRRAQQSALGH
jgi:hypothetical protein